MPITACDRTFRVVSSPFSLVHGVVMFQVEGVETTRFRVTSTQRAEVNESGIHARGRTQFFSVRASLLALCG